MERAKQKDKRDKNRLSFLYWISFTLVLLNSIRTIPADNSCSDIHLERNQEERQRKKITAKKMRPSNGCPLHDSNEIQLKTISAHQRVKREQDQDPMSR